MPCRRAWQPTPVFLPGASLWTEEPGGRQSMRSQRVGYDRSDLACTHTTRNWWRETTPKLKEITPKSKKKEYIKNI